VADAGDDVVVNATDRAELDGTGSTDPDRDALTYNWTQTAGPSIPITDSDTATPSFTAPDVNERINAVFELRVSDGSTSDTDTVTVRVDPAPTVEPAVSATFATGVQNVGAPVSVNVTATNLTEGDTSIRLRYDGEVRNTTTCQTASCTVQLSTTPTASSWNDTTDRYEPVELTISVVGPTGASTETVVETPVSIAGDANADGTVNIFDAVTVGRAWQSTRGEDGYSPAADLNNDGKVNIFDAVTIGRNWQSTAG
jgi:hypothetical protein